MIDTTSNEEKLLAPNDPDNFAVSLGDYGLVNIFFRPGNPITLCEIIAPYGGFLSYGVSRLKHGDIYDPELGRRYALKSALRNTSSFDKPECAAIWGAYFIYWPRIDAQLDFIRKISPGQTETLLFDNEDHAARFVYAVAHGIDYYVYDVKQRGEKVDVTRKQFNYDHALLTKKTLRKLISLRSDVG